MQKQLTTGSSFQMTDGHLKPLLCRDLPLKLISLLPSHSAVFNKLTSSSICKQQTELIAPQYLMNVLSFQAAGTISTTAHIHAHVSIPFSFPCQSRQVHCKAMQVMACYD